MKRTRAGFLHPSICKVPNCIRVVKFKDIPPVQYRQGLVVDLSTCPHDARIQTCDWMMIICDYGLVPNEVVRSDDRL